MSQLHEKLVVIDGLIISKWGREVFMDMRKGGITAANCTVSVWEGFQQTVNNIIDMRRHIENNKDILSEVRITADIKQAKSG